MNAPPAAPQDLVYCNVLAYAVIQRSYNHPYYLHRYCSFYYFVLPCENLQHDTAVVTSFNADHSKVFTERRGKPSDTNKSA